MPKENILKRHFKQTKAKQQGTKRKRKSKTEGKPIGKQDVKQDVNHEEIHESVNDPSEQYQGEYNEQYDEYYNEDQEYQGDYAEEEYSEQQHVEPIEEPTSKKTKKEPAQLPTTSPIIPDEQPPKPSKNFLIPKSKSNQRIDLGKEWSALKNPSILPELLSIIHDDFGFKNMSPVQETTIPLLLNNKDVVVQALTGSGKTLAFVLPIFQYVMAQKFDSKVPTAEEMATKKKNVYSIIMLPTRELARQVYEVANKFASKTNFIVKLFIGGEERETSKPATEFISQAGSGNENVSAADSTFLDCNIAIGTPGRLLDYLNSKLLKVRTLEILVIDEADIILNMGFRQQVDQILSYLPKQRRTGLFSATQTSELDELVRSGLRNPMKVTANENEGNEKKKATVPSQLTNLFIYCDYTQKLNYVMHLLKNDEPMESGNSIIIYFLTCACVDYFHKVLKQLLGKKEETIQLFSLHGQMVQKRRNAEHLSFKEACENIAAQKVNSSESQPSKKAVLLCTDVAARGLDFPNISTIVQFDAPTNPDQFVHRVGRTARMGREGQSLLFLSKSESDYIDYLSIKKIQMHELEPTDLMLQHNFVDKESMKKIIKSDRDIFEKGEEALKSFVRSYKEHQCSYIFKFNKLRFDHLLEAFSIMNKPTIREMKQQVEELTLPYSDIDIDSIPYKDDRREKARKERLKKQVELEKEREERKKALVKEHREQKKTSVNYLKDKVRNRSDLSSREKKQIYNRIENHEFNEEALMLKRLKRGKISQKEYDELTGESKMEEDILKKLSERTRKQYASQFKKK